MQNYKIIGRDNNLNVIQWPSGAIEKISDDDLAALQGGKAVKKLSDERRIAELESKLADAIKANDHSGVELSKAQVELNALRDVVDEWQERATKAEATIEELQAANAALENKVRALEAEKTGIDSSGESSAPGTTTTVIEPTVFSEALALEADLKKLTTWDLLRACAEALGLTVADNDSKAKIKAAIEAERTRRAGA